MPEPYVTVPISRRRFGQYFCGAVAAALWPARTTRSSPSTGSARLHVRPGPPSSTAVPGVTPLGLATGRDGFLYVPTSYNAAKPSPLLVTLHGATMNSRFGVNLWRDLADARGVVVLSPDSRDTTWDGIRGRFAADVEFLDQALTRAFQRCTIDASRVVLHGFSDGASYGLALALANGDLFKHAIASSPGFIPSSDSPNVGRAKIFISHGRQDQILPIESTSALLVPELRGRGFDVQYRQFDGGHRVPPEIAQAAMEWALGS